MIIKLLCVLTAIHFLLLFAFQDGLPISQHCPELSAYIREETLLLQDEIASLEKVSTKLEREIQLANKTQGPYLNSQCLSLHMYEREVIDSFRKFESFKNKYTEEGRVEVKGGLISHLMGKGDT